MCDGKESFREVFARVRPSWFSGERSKQQQQQQQQQQNCKKKIQLIGPFYCA